MFEPVKYSVHCFSNFVLSVSDYSESIILYDEIAPCCLYALVTHSPCSSHCTCGLGSKDFCRALPCFDSNLVEVKSDES